MAIVRRYLPEGYRENFNQTYCIDDVVQRQVHQPDAYGVADYLCRSAERTVVMDLGCGSGRKLTRLRSAKRLVGCDIGLNLEAFRQNNPGGKAVAVDLSDVSMEDLPSQNWADCVVICADVIEHIVDPTSLVRTLVRLAQAGAIVVVTTPDRERLSEQAQFGPPQNPSHVREWTLAELARYFTELGAAPAFAGRTASDNLARYRGTSILILDSKLSVPPFQLQQRPLGIVATYNDGDCIEAISKYHLNDGLDLHFIDNWSTDETFERLLELQASAPGRVTLERFPEEGPVNQYSWTEILQRKEQIALGFPGRWILHIDSDEHRAGPWPDVSLAEALARAQSYGANCVDFCVVEFPPVADHFDAGSDPLTFFSRYKFARHLAHFAQRRAWLQPAERVDLASTGGHDVALSQRVVFPYRFYLGHYPLRSTEHAQRKILADRRPRFTAQERDGLGWHNHYNFFTRDTPVVQWEALLEPFNFDVFRTEMMPELVTDIVWQRVTGYLNW